MHIKYKSKKQPRLGFKPRIFCIPANCLDHYASSILVIKQLVIVPVCTCYIQLIILVYVLTMYVHIHELINWYKHVHTCQYHGFDWAAAGHQGPLRVVGPPQITRAGAARGRGPQWCAQGVASGSAGPPGPVQTRMYCFAIFWRDLYAHVELEIFIQHFNFRDCLK
jgi:hypothetical protein